MARPSGVSKLVFRGTLPGGERWATGLWKPVGAAGATAAQELSAIIVLGSFAPLITALKTLLVTTGTYDGVDLYQYRSAGGVSDKATSPANSGAGSGGGQLPNQISLVMTLRTANLTRSGRGRMFFSATGSSMAGSGLLASTGTATLRGALATFIGDVDGVVVSETRGESYPIVSVDNDLRPDVIRARAIDIAAPRSSSAVPA